LSWGSRSNFCVERDGFIVEPKPKIEWGRSAPEVPGGGQFHRPLRASGNPLQVGFERQRKIDVWNGLPEARSAVFGDFRAVDLPGLSASEKGRFPAPSLRML